MGKVVYETRAAAEVALAAERRYRGLVLRPYRCPSCHAWHLSSWADREQLKKQGLR